MAGVGVAQQFWLRVEQERVAKGWTKDRLSVETARFTPDGRPIPRSTIDNLRNSKRAPQPRIVHGIADALGVDRTEAAQLAGLIPPPGDQRISVRDAVRRSVEFTDDQKATLLGVIDALDAANRAYRDRINAARSDDAQEAM